MHTVLVTDGDSRAGLTVIRSLGRRGVKVIAGSKRKLAMGLFSRFTYKPFIYPAPENHLKQFQRKILYVINRYKVDYVIPVSDVSILALSQISSKFKSSIPPKKVLSIVQDKKRTLNIAKEIGIPVPKTFRISSVREFPIIIKPRHSVSFKDGIFRHHKVEIACDRQSMIRKFDKIKTLSGEEPLLEELIHGQECGYFALFDKGKPVQSFLHQRLRTMPISGGVSTFRRGIKNKEVASLGERLLRKIKWHGVAMVEFKYDNKEKKYKLMEINGRFWGSLALAVHSGVDFPYLLFLLDVLNKKEKPIDYPTNVYSSWFLFGDLSHLLIKLFKYPEKRKTMKEFWQLIHDKNVHFDILSKQDPLPALFQIFSFLVYDLFDFNRIKEQIKGRHA